MMTGTTIMGEWLPAVRNGARIVLVLVPFALIEGSVLCLTCFLQRGAQRMTTCKLHQMATFILMGLLFLQLTGLTCLGEEVADSAQASVYSEDHTRSAVDRAVDANQDDCPCHLQFSAVEPVSHEAMYRVTLAPAITPLFYTPLFPFNLLRPPLGN